ncbi:MAG TPA: hypothetical protein PKV21_08695, partial [bacterium]|nr:hypothetical protein [bacterium]
KKIINLSYSENYLKRFCEVLNLDEKYLIYEEKKFDDFDVNIIAGDINLKRPQKDMQFIFVNERPVYDYVLSSAVNNFYQSIFFSEFFPVFSLFLKVPSENIDVNIHPAKREIKSESEIARKIVELLKEILRKGKVKTIEVEKKYEEAKKELTDEEKIKEKNNIFIETEKNSEELFILEKKEEFLKEKIKKSSFIGIFKFKYLIFEVENNLLIIDQHAAMERIVYEKFIDEVEKGNLQIQQLLTPVIIDLNPEEMTIYEKTEKILEKYGFLTTRWSENRIAIHGYPFLIKDIEFAIRNILGEKDVKKYEKEDIAKRACKVSIMAGEKISEKEARYIVEKLSECKNPFVCPHGRPVVIEISERFLDSQFSR